MNRPSLLDHVDRVIKIEFSQPRAYPVGCSGCSIHCPPYQKEEAPMHPSSAHLLQFFKYDHLMSPLREVSQPFCELADMLARLLPQNPETTAALRKLLEAKDCAVRAVLAGQNKASG